MNESRCRERSDEEIEKSPTLDTSRPTPQVWPRNSVGDR